jgi:hypothetical protein
MLLISVRGPEVRFTEIDLFGVSIAPMSMMIVAAWVGTIALRWSAARYDLLRTSGIRRSLYSQSI